MSYRPLDKRQREIASIVYNVRQDSIEPGYQHAIRCVAHAFANEICTGNQRPAFLMACGVDARPVSKVVLVEDFDSLTSVDYKTNGGRR